MRIVEVRRVMDYFVVFVNDPKDIKILENHALFSVYATYKDKTHKFYGVEYQFKCDAAHKESAKRLIKSILQED